MGIIYFLGRFHVLALHLPIGIILVAIWLEWLARKEKYRYLDAAAPFLWGAAAITAIGTATLGYLHFAEGGFTGTSAMAHRFFGTSVAVVTTAVWLLRSKSLALYRHAHWPLAAVLLVLVTLTGHYGGNLTHGNTYLVEYAPAPLRRLAGMDTARPPVTDMALADPYLDIVRPIFSQRCFSCHNDDKQRGGLNLANYPAAVKGGEKGAVLVAGKPQQSDLYRRITLAHDAKDFMPAEGKTPLTEQQVAIVQWWIEAGLPTNTKLAELKVPEPIKQLLAAQLTPGTDPPQAAAAAAVNVDPVLLAKLNEAGFLVRQVSQSDAALIVSPAGAGTTFSAEQVAVLGMAGQHIVSLSLQSSGLDDAALEMIGGLSQLKTLRLDNNRLTPAGLAMLKPLTQLESLNLYGNAGITDAGVDALAALSGLKRVYLWGTQVSPRGAARLKQLHADLQIDLGS